MEQRGKNGSNTIFQANGRVDELILHQTSVSLNVSNPSRYILSSPIVLLPSNIRRHESWGS